MDTSLLVERARAGDQSAFDALVRAHERQVFNLAWRLTGNYHDANDVAVDAFIRVYQGLGSYRGDASFSTWLHRVVVNTYLDFRKRKQNRPMISLEETVSRGGEDAYERQIEDPNPGPDELLVQKAESEILQRAIDRLPEDRRILVVLYHFGEQGYEEIASILGIPIGTVKSRLNRARLALRDILANHQEPT